MPENPKFIFFIIAVSVHIAIHAHVLLCLFCYESMLNKIYLFTCVNGMIVYNAGNHCKSTKVINCQKSLLKNCITY